MIAKAELLAEILRRQPTGRWGLMLHARWEAMKHVRVMFPRRGCRIWRWYSHFGLKTYGVFCECGKEFH